MWILEYYRNQGSDKTNKSTSVAICWDSSYVYVHVYKEPLENKEHATWIHCLMLCYVLYHQMITVAITFEDNCNHGSEINTICIIGFYPGQE